MFEKETDPKRVAEQLLQRKKDEDIHVVGHYHQSFFEPEKGVIMLGAWQTPTMEDEEAGFIPDLMEILLIREDGKLELIREH
jgi:predicted phosphodiesterase